MAKIVKSNESGNESFQNNSFRIHFLFVMQALQPGMPHLSVHGKEKFGVVFGVFDALLHFGHGFDGVHLGDVVSKHPHSLQCDVVMQQIVSSCGRCGEVDCGEDSFVGETAFELEFGAPMPMALTFPMPPTASKAGCRASTEALT